MSFIDLTKDSDPEDQDIKALGLISLFSRKRKSETNSEEDLSLYRVPKSTSPAKSKEDTHIKTTSSENHQVVTGPIFTAKTSFTPNHKPKPPSTGVVTKIENLPRASNEVNSPNKALSPRSTLQSTTITSQLRDGQRNSAFSVVIPPSPIPALMNARAHGAILPRGRKSTHARTSSDEETPSTGHSESPEPKGLSFKYYPVDALEERARRGAYPAVRAVHRDDVKIAIPPLPIRSTPRERDSHPLSKKRYLRGIVLDKLSKVPGPPVGIDFKGIDSLTLFASNFEFVSSYVLRKGVEPVDEQFRYGCDCGLVCGTTSCSCLSLERDSTDTIVPYNKLPDGTSVLARDFLKRTAMIFECSSLCGCDKTCWNRVVERGRTVQLEIFHTGDRGLGLRSPDIIRAGQFIDCYLGEVITEKEADLREEASGSQLTPSYLFSLDFLRESDEDEIYVVDGQRLGSAMRFMNHSCKPNCKLFPASRNHADNRLYDLAFFSLRDIPPMQELTFDYNPQMEADREIDPNAVRCLCGESNCRGQLWPNDRKRTGC